MGVSTVRVPLARAPVGGAAEGVQPVQILELERAAGSHHREAAPHAAGPPAAEILEQLIWAETGVEEDGRGGGCARARTRASASDPRRDEADHRTHASGIRRNPQHDGTTATTVIEGRVGGYV